ncbi:MAG: hypothetical protein QT01_C0006G0005 [archaeon GW2011_AR6]|nr:MAG: hypothetical protein QT01_C0006G0005 [archaeon GW2011_AR6]
MDYAVPHQRKGKNAKRNKRRFRVYKKGRPAPAQS